MNDDSPIVDRLRELGREPIDPSLQSLHLTLMSNSASSGRKRLVRRLQVGAAAAFVVLAVPTALSAADIDAGPVSDLGAKVAGVLGADIADGKVTHGTERHYGSECLPIADGKGAANHGQYLKWIRENRPDMLEQAKASNCGKPLTAGTEDDGDD